MYDQNDYRNTDTAKENVLGKIFCGEVLDRDDLIVICYALTQQSHFFFDGDIYDKNLLGYKKIGKKGQGKTPAINTKLHLRNKKILNDYIELTAKSNSNKLKFNAAVEKLANESFERYGESIGERAIRSVITLQRKLRAHLEKRVKDKVNI